MTGWLRRKGRVMFQLVANWVDAFTGEVRDEVVGEFKMLDEVREHRETLTNIARRGGFDNVMWYTILGHTVQYRFTDAVWVVCQRKTYDTGLEDVVPCTRTSRLETPGEPTEIVEWQCTHCAEIVDAVRR